MEAAEMAKTQWVRMVSNLNLGAYDVYTATADLPEPDWPSLTLKEIMRIAFGDYYINSVDHPVIKRLRGAT
jgi:hypothetical protein